MTNLEKSVESVALSNYPNPPSAESVNAAASTHGISSEDIRRAVRAYYFYTNRDVPNNF